MKTTLKLLIFLIAISAIRCELRAPWEERPGVPCIDDYTFDYIEKEEFIDAETYEPILQWLRLNYDPAFDFWGDDRQLPHETYARREGDCEDWVGLAIQFLHDAGWEVFMLEIKRSGRTGKHAIFELEGLHYEGTGELVIYSDYEVVERWSYCKAIGLLSND